MIKKVDELYQCEECKLLYQELGWAEKCENWCKEYKSCNLDITSHAVSKDKLSLE